MPQTQPFIAVDWGTTNARAYLLDAAGAVVDRRAAASGILNVPDNRFAEAFDDLVGDWRRHETVPVLMSGMIGSRQGWVEADYVECPASPDELARNLRPVAERDNVSIVPGVCLPAGSAHADVMRGEEVQCFGALELSAAGDGVVCLPGTHSKWVGMSGGRLARFATSMTGEAFAVLREHSILARLMEQPEEDPAGPGFLAGVGRSADAGGLLNHLFSVRADGLFDKIPATALAGYLSGILIGHEVRSMRDMFGPFGTVLVVGGGGLVALYGAAFEVLGLAYRTLDADAATLAGLAAIRDAAASGPA